MLRVVFVLHQHPFPCDISSLRKPKHPRARRELQKREAKIVENVKEAIVIKGSSPSQLVQDACADLVRVHPAFTFSFMHIRLHLKNLTL